MVFEDERAGTPVLKMLKRCENKFPLNIFAGHLQAAAEL